MVIIPTEKRFDWNRAPTVLFTIVMLNLLTYVIYQTGDDAKFSLAYEEYQTRQFIEIEWPIFQTYLKEHQETELLSEYTTDYKHQDTEAIIADIISNRDFYEYLQANIYQHLTVEQQSAWEAPRRRIHGHISNISAYAFGFTPKDFSLITLFSSQFLHGDMMHLLGNMFFLIICGFAVEAAIGHRLFLAFYLASGVAGNILTGLLDINGTIPSVGASGAISGVMAMYLAIFRLKKIEFFYWFYIFVGYFRAPALVILPCYITKELLSFFLETDSNIGFMAHFGGFLIGGILIAALFKLKPDILDEEYIEEDDDLDPYQQSLATAYRYIENFQFKLALQQVDKIIKDHGNDFELSVLKYNLAKLEKTQGFKELTIQILNTKNPTSDELITIEQIWLDNPAINNALNEKQLISLGMRFASLRNPSSSEKIFNHLHNAIKDKSKLSTLAHKLSVCFDKLQDHEKKQQYANLSKSFLSGETL